MKNYIRWSLMFLLISLSSVYPLLAQDDSAGPNTFAGRPTLWVAIIIGFAATAATAVYARQLQGGVVGTALAYISGGMLLVVLGFLAVVVSWADADVQAIVHDILFIIGYILMLFGALRLRRML